MTSYSVFDLIGPVMVGPSSSHTAGANRIGYISKHIIGEPIEKVVFYLHGSFAKTHKGHGTDKALLAGILGCKPDDERIRDAFDLAKEANLDFDFQEADLGDVHPNTVKVVATPKSNPDNKWVITASSIGGGKVKITRINQMEVDFDGEFTTLITHHKDCPGMVANITKVLSDYEINIAFMKLFRAMRGEDALLLIETDEIIPAEAAQELEKISDIHSSKIIPKCQL